MKLAKNYETIEVKGKKVEALIDTASDLSLLRVDYFEKIGVPYVRRNVTRFGGIGSNNSHLSTLGVTILNLT